MSGRDILMAVVGRPHGVRGLVRLRSYATDPASLADLVLHDGRGGSWRIEWRGDGIASLRDGAGRAVADRTEAERLVNLRLHVSRDALPAPAVDEFYLADLVGLAARGPDGALLGAVRAVHDYGAGASLEIVPPDDTAATFLVPFTRQAVPTVDVAGGLLLVCRPDEVEAVPS